MFGLLLMLAQFGAIDVSLHGVHDRPAPQQLSYDATEARDRRKSPPVTHRSEDLILDQGRRSRLTANARDIARNFSVAGWLVRRHLDYVATFDFHMRTDDEDFNQTVEEMMWDWSRPHNCDAAGRHSLAKIIRIAEARAVLDGDIGLLKLRDGTLQGIESDRIRDYGQATGRWVHGVKVNPAGRALAYAIHTRGQSGFEFERTVPARSMLMHGYYDRFDQVRGISPLASALNPLRDSYEAATYALGKMKVSQLFAMAIFRKAVDSAGEIQQPNDLAEEQQMQAAAQPRPEYKVNFGTGPVLLDLDPGDEAKFLESGTPSTQFQEFYVKMLDCALKALDCPYSFADEAHTNFFASRAAWLHYERSCHFKRESLAALLNRITTWRVMLWILDGDLALPAGMTMRDIDWEWIPRGMPWWDPSKEISGDLLAIGAGLDNPQRICKERGRGDFYDNVLEIAKAQKFCEEHGVRLNLVPPAPTVEVVPADEVEK